MKIKGKKINVFDHLWVKLQAITATRPCRDPENFNWILEQLKTLKSYLPFAKTW